MSQPEFPPGPPKPRRTSAGIVLYRHHNGSLEVLLGHMGGPFWQRRDAGAWSIPKGGYDSDEDAFAAAQREFEEEVGLPSPQGTYLPLGEVLQANNKVVSAWAVAGDLDPAQAHSCMFELEWPPNSGQRQQFPEFDKLAWFTIVQARPLVVRAQREFLDRLEQSVSLDTADADVGSS